MPVELATPKPPRFREWNGSAFFLAIGFCVAATFASLFVLSLPITFALPVFSVIAVLTATFVALLTWLYPQHGISAAIDYWNIAGALTIVGISAALLSDPDHVISFLEAKQTD